MKKLFFLLIFSVFCSGCLSTSPFQPLQIDGLIFQNRARTPIENIMLYVENTREFASCSYVLAGGSFSTRFPAQRYRGNYAVVTWELQKRKWTSKRFVIRPPKDLDNNKPVKALIVFFDDGRIDPRIVQ